MTADTCPVHAPHHPGLAVPQAAPCPFEGCPYGWPQRRWNAPNGERYVRSLDLFPQSWVRLSSIPALDTRTEGT